MNNNYFFKHKIIILNNHQGHSCILFLRKYEPNDEVGIIQCIKDEYGSTYFKQNFYDEEWLLMNANGDHYCFFVVETYGEIIGITALTFFTNSENYIEPASQIIRKKYRGYGLADKLVDYVFPIAEELMPNCLLVHAVTFHKITQSLCEARGMIPTGFRIGTFLTKSIINSYELRDCEKYSEGILVKAVNKKDAGIIYLPSEISVFGRKIYTRLGVRYEIRNCIGAVDYSLSNKTQLVIKYDELQKNVLVTIRKIGNDLADKIKEVIDSFKKNEPWTMQVTLSISTPDIFYAYAELKKLGLFFSGLKPLCSDIEQMYMQWTGDIKINMDQYVLTSSFDEIRKDIESFYLCRTRGVNNDKDEGQID